MIITDGDRAELRCILMAVRDSDLRLIDPDLTRLVVRALDIVTDDEDRARAADLRARLAARQLSRSTST